ncbi:IclR family transcriptional regulator [Natronolimnobius sp. AArcel1]|uniref:IclR family transcriptional regulator n=1 Tax=Natronolimnobius sp. AArcel1 TaxID=1679093 RepID=UPI0013EE21BF|nr:IclR family transcriptional regulator [Natronolimnobius sp. AArcel1]NGM70360.1 IclR family transcriptional regulator [Natronolimnobius sp. AArcel1]
MAKTSSQGKIGAVETAFEIVDTLESENTMGVSEVATELDLPKSTAHVYLKTLESEGYAINEDGRYRLSLRFLKHGGEARNRLKLYRAAKSHVDELANETGEAGNLGVEERGQRIIVYKSEVKNAIYDNTPTGEHTNLHWTALGKAILAHLPADRVDEVIDEHGLPKRTQNTITDRNELEVELNQIRERGYSFEKEERREGVTAIAVPIQDKDDPETVHSVSISGPTKRIKRGGTVRSDLIDAVKQTANVIELQYNHY